MAFSETWNGTYESLPTDAEDAKDGADRIRDLKVAIRERTNLDDLITGVSIGGTLNVQTSAAGIGNGADTTTDTLFTYTLPANSLSIDGQGIHVKAWGTLAANLNLKTIGISFAGVLSSGTLIGNASVKYWLMEADIVRIDSTHVSIIWRSFNTDNATDSDAVKTAVLANQVVADLSANTSIILATGRSPVAGAASDVLGNAMKVLFEG